MGENVEKYQFTAVITGDLGGAKVSITGKTVNEETGEKVRDLPGRDNEYSNVAEAAYEVGTFFTGFGLSVGRRTALATGDFVTAIKLTAIAESLGIPLPPLDEETLTTLAAGLDEQGDEVEQTPVTGVTETVKAALNASAGEPGDGSNN